MKRQKSKKSKKTKKTGLSFIFFIFSKIINHTVNLHFFFPIHLHKIPGVETTPKIKGNEKI
jgi:hypothetical protein